eukprot:94058_1
MWSKFTNRISPSLCRAFLSTSIPTCIAASVITTASSNDKTQRMTGNRILSDKHRIAIAGWPVHQSTNGNPNDNRINTLEALTKYLKHAGYEGIELKFAHFKNMYYKDSLLSNLEIAKEIKEKFDKYGLKIFGVLLHSKSEHWDKQNVDKYLSDLRESLQYNKAMGAEYVTFQIWLPEKYLYGDGSYRNNNKLLEEYINRIGILQSICYENELNFYVETHVGRLSEDPEAFVKIMNGYNGSFEINGDLSHYICRGMLSGPFVDEILSKMEHTHVRMARVYGDLSVDVIDPIKDWNDENGVTQTYWKFTKKGFKNGLSSRVIVGEAGPMHLVDDALKQDKKMVPLLKSMAKYCDLQAQTNNFDKQNFNPFQPQ